MKKTVLITGASSGIGKSLSVLYIKKGYKVIAISRNIKKLNKLKNDISNDNLIIKVCDLCKEDDIELLIKYLKDLNINIDILINNAGIGIFKKFSDSKVDDIKNILNTNLIGHLFITLKVLKNFKISNISFISSLAGKIGFRDLTIYSSSKFAIEGFCDALKEEVDKNIKITIIRPGIVNTNFFNNTDFINYANKIRNKMQQPEFVSNEIYNAINKGKTEYTIGKDKYFLILQKILPKFLHRKLLNLFIN